MADIKLTHIPYKGSAPALTDLIGGHVAIYFASLPPAIALVKDGKVRALAVTGPTRSPIFSRSADGRRGGASRLRGRVALRHRGTPPAPPRAIIDKLNAALNAALADPEVRARIAVDGAEPLPTTPEQYRRRYRPRGNQVVEGRQAVGRQGGMIEETMIRVPAISRVCARARRIRRHRARAGLSHAHDHADRALSAGRRRRRDGTHRCRQALAGARPAGPGRQSRRRLGPGRHAPPRSARRRMATRCSSAIPARSQINPSLYANSGYDPRKAFAPIGLIAAMPVALIANAKRAGEDDRRPGGADEGQPRQVHDRHVGGRHRRVPLGRTVPLGHRHRRHHRALQGNGRRDERPARRPRPGRVRRAAARARQHPVRRAAGGRGAGRAALQPAAPTCRPPPRAACRASSRCCITACWRRPARRGRSSTSSTRRCASWSPPTR